MLCLVLSSSATIGLAQSNDKLPKTILTPEKDSAIIMDEVSILDDGSVQLGHTKKVTDPPAAYSIQINKEKGTYKVTQKELTESQLQEIAAAKIQTPQSITTTQHYTAWTELDTWDAASQLLCKSKLQLWWYDYGSTVGPDTATLTPWSDTQGNNWPLHTHWYLSSQNKPAAFLNTDHTKLTQNADTHFYNYDYGDSQQATYQNHNMTMYAYSNDTWSWVYTAPASGEDWVLLNTTWLES